MQEGSFQFESVTREDGVWLAVTGATEDVRDLLVPDSHAGSKVREIGAHAFAGHRHLRFVSLPESIDTIGAFAFHNCKALSGMELFDSAEEYGDGAIRQCTALKDVRMSIRKNNFQTMARMLSDCDNTVTFTLLFQDGEARLTFPGFNYDFTENTMARTIQFNIEGSGMAFRECVSRNGLDFSAYDKLFSRAKLDNISVTTQVVLNRLVYPYGLSGQAKETYEAYIRGHADGMLSVLVRARNMAGIRFLCAEENRTLLNKQALGEATLLAASLRDTETTALLTDCASHTDKGAGRKMMTL